MSKYNFKVIAEVKPELSEQERVRANDLISYWIDKTNLVQQDERTFLRSKTNNQDLPSVILFAHKLSKYPNFFSLIEEVNLVSNDVIRFI